MLHWLQNVLPKSNLFFQLLGLSIFLHFLLVIFLTSIGYFSNKSIKFTVNANLALHEPIYFMPLAKTANIHIGKPLETPRKRAEAETQKKPTASSMNKNPRIVKKNVDNAHKKSTVNNKPVDRQSLKKKARATPEKIDPRIKNLAEKVKYPDALEKLRVNIPDLSKVDLSIQSKSVNLESAQNADGLILGREDLDSLRLYQSIQSEINKYWNPPVGLSKDLECEIKACVDAQGKIYKINIEKSSGVLVYDMSAKMAFSQVRMPKEVYNKHIILAFKQ